MSSGSAAKEFEAVARDCVQLAAQAIPPSFVRDCSHGPPLCLVPRRRARGAGFYVGEDGPHATIRYEANLRDTDNAWLRLHYRANGEAEAELWRAVRRGRAWGGTLRYSICCRAVAPRLRQHDHTRADSARRLDQCWSFASDRTNSPFQPIVRDRRELESQAEHPCAGGPVHPPKGSISFPFALKGHARMQWGTDRRIINAEQPNSRQSTQGQARGQGGHDLGGRIRSRGDRQIRRGEHGARFPTGDRHRSFEGPARRRCPWSAQERQGQGPYPQERRVRL